MNTTAMNSNVSNTIPNKRLSSAVNGTQHVSDLSNSDSTSIESIREQRLALNLHISEKCNDEIIVKKKTFEMENIPTVAPSRPQSRIGEVEENRGKPVEKKSKLYHSWGKLPQVLWIHQNLSKKRYTERYRLSTRTPSVRTGLMLAFNLYYVQPTQTKKSLDQITSEYYVKGGANEDSFYVKQLNEPMPNAVAMVLAQGATVHISMLKGFHDIFDAFNKGQGEKVLPTKAEAAQLTPANIRGICNRIAIQSGFSKGVSQCRCLPLETWNESMAKLYKKTPYQAIQKAAKNPLEKITLLYDAFQAEYSLQVELSGAELQHDTEMYETELDALVQAIATIYARDGAKLFRDAIGLVILKKEYIKSTAGKLGAELKRKGTVGLTAMSPTSSTAVSQKTVQIQINHLSERVNDISNTIINCPVTSPTEHVVKQMISLPSAYMKYVGENNVPSFEDMISASGDRNGKKNDMMIRMLGRRGNNLWMACIALILSAHHQEIDCSKIAGESNAISSGNRVSGYDKDGHMGSVVRASIQGNFKKQKDTFSCQFVQMLSFADAKTKTYWPKIKKELVDMIHKFFPDDTKVTETFTSLQLNIGNVRQIRALVQQPKVRKTVIVELKWVFLLYCEMLPSGEIPTLANFISVMLSKMGVSLCNAYLAWISTGYYNLKAKAHAGEPLPSHIKLRDTSSSPSIHNTVYGNLADDIFAVLEALILAEWSNDQSILCGAQQNAKKLPLSESHTNTHLGRAAGAWAYWCIGVIRIIQQIAPRTGILEQIAFYTTDEWKAREPGKNSQMELRLGLSFITGAFGDVTFVHAHKTTGSGHEATSLFEDKAMVGHVIHGGQWSGTSGSAISNYGTWDSSKLKETFHRLKDAAAIIGGDPNERKYLVNVKDPITGQFKELTSSVLSSPSMPIYSKYHHSMPQSPGDPRTFEQLLSPLEKYSGQGMHRHLTDLAKLNIRPCHRPPRGHLNDHTLAKTKTHSSTAKKLAELFRKCIAPAIVSENPLEMGKEWDLKSIKKPVLGEGHVAGRITAQSKYKFKPTNVATILNLERFGISADQLASVKLLCREIAAGRMHVHANFFGRQTKLSQLIGIRETLRQIPDWDDGEAPDRRLKGRILEMAKAQLHELPRVIKVHYTDVHKTDLGNPVNFFARFDERIRAHPTQPVFDLNGIEAWPTTVVVPHKTRDSTIQPLQYAFTDVRNLSISEQNLNMTTLIAYRDSLQWIIDNQVWLEEKDPSILRWFEERANYDPMDIETPVRRSARARKPTAKRKSNSLAKQKKLLKRNKSSANSSPKQKTLPE